MSSFNLLQSIGFISTSKVERRQPLSTGFNLLQSIGFISTVHTIFFVRSPTWRPDRADRRYRAKPLRLARLLSHFPPFQISDVPRLSHWRVSPGLLPTASIRARPLHDNRPFLSWL